MTTTDRYDEFLALHQQETPLLIPNPWDVGSAKVLESLGFQALATTSSGFAATLGRLDGNVTRDEVLTHCRALATATTLPISADYENGFADAPDDVAESVRLATATGIAGCSIEDYSGSADEPIYERGHAVDRVRAAAEAAHGAPNRLVLTARCENFLRGRIDLADTIERLQAYQVAGADVVFAPRVVDPVELRTLVDSVDVPVNVLATPDAPSVAELGTMGVKRVSVGGAFAYAAIAGLIAAATELRDHGTYGYWAQSGPGMVAAKAALAT